MNFKQLGSMALSLLMFTACQNGASEAGNEAEEPIENQEQTEPDNENAAQQRQMPGEGMPQPATDVSDEELQEFAAIANELQGMSQQAQQQMMAAVQEEGLQVQRFSQIQQAQQSPDQQANATEEEMEQYNAALAELEKIQGEVQSEMQATIEEAGMTEMRYQQIGMAIRTNPELQAKFQAMQQPQQQPTQPAN